MGILRNFVSKLHQSTRRNYLKRMTDNKAYCMKVAKKYEKDYWDGNRKFGYGGYKYIPGRWKLVAKEFIKTYKLKPGSKILDVGCGKGFLLYEMLLIEPKLKIYGFDISKHALKSAPKQIRRNLFIHKAQNNFGYKKNFFDLVISLNTLHNLKIFELRKALKEISRVGKKSYILVESFRNEKELLNLECWALTCESFFDQKGWMWIYDHFRYNGDYEFIYFE